MDYRVPVLVSSPTHLMIAIIPHTLKLTDEDFVAFRFGIIKCENCMFFISVCTLNLCFIEIYILIKYDMNYDLVLS